MDTTKTFPDWSALLDLWLKTHYEGQPAVIFCHPLGGDPMGIADRVKLIRERFGNIDGMMVSAEYAILPCASVEEANKILHETPKENPYTLVWDGRMICNHH